MTWKPGQPSDRQRWLVDILTNGFGCSLNHAMRLSKYGKHRPGLDQILASPEVVQLFRKALEAGKPLPPKFAARIIQAIAAADVEALR